MARDTERRKAAEERVIALVTTTRTWWVRTCLTVLLVFFASVGAIADDRGTLESIYHATDGPNWRRSGGWLTDRPIHDWFGVSAFDENFQAQLHGPVTALSLSNNNLSGNIPAAVGSLASLHTLGLADNNLSGSIPAAVGSLASLRRLFLDGNNLSGPVPAALGQLSLDNRNFDVSFDSNTGLCLPPDFPEFAGPPFGQWRLPDCDDGEVGTLEPTPGQCIEARIFGAPCFTAIRERVGGIWNGIQDTVSTMVEWATFGAHAETYDASVDERIDELCNDPNRDPGWTFCRNGSSNLRAAASDSVQLHFISSNPAVIDVVNNGFDPPTVMVDPRGGTVTMYMTVIGPTGAAEATIRADDIDVPASYAITAMSDADVQSAFDAAIAEAAAGNSRMAWEPGGEVAMVALDKLFDVPESIMASYLAESSDSDDVMAMIVGDHVALTPMSAGMAEIRVTAVDAAEGMATTVMATVMVMAIDPAAITYTLSGPEDMNLAEGMSAMVTVMASDAVPMDTEVMITRDRAASSADDDDYMAEPITIMAGATAGRTMVMAVEDNMAEDMEELVLFAMAGESMVEGEVKLYLWDAAAVPALSIIAQLLLAGILGLGGFRRYLRRR